MRVALVEFFIKQEQSFAFIIAPYSSQSRNEPHLVCIDFGESDLQSLKSTIWSFGKSLTIVERNMALFQEIGSALFQPIVDYLGDCDVLYLVPHKSLHYLPLHAIMINGKLLYERYAIVYLPTASLLKFCQKNNQLRSNQTYTYRQILSLGVGATEDRRGFQLKFKSEAEQVATVFDSAHCYCFTGIQASKVAFLKYSPGSDLIHIASHGFFNSSAPLGSGLLLAHQNRLPSMDGHYMKNHILTAETFFQLRLRANLMVLSGCFTGRSEVRPGDELLGLVRGVFAAGVPSMVVSLWEAHHGATMLFMETFYAELEKGVAKALAIQTAQHRLRNTAEYSHIKYWAPFILIGAWL